MGYKRAGFRVLGNVEIDPRVNAVYKRNFHPEYNFCEDIRDFNKREDLPDELYSLDILDGSPPCTTFSMAGKREATWGVEKKFREGQKKQRLDDLFFHFLDTVERLKPKIVIAENVTGLLQGNARQYAQRIFKRFKEAGYTVQVFELNAADMNVPQIRKRVFFIANNQGYGKIRLKFNEKPICFGKVRSEHGVPMQEDSVTSVLLNCIQPGDTSLGDVNARVRGRYTYFNQKIVWDDKVAPTLVTGVMYRAYDRTRISKQDIVNISTFPQDYDFLKEDPNYICGMCVPPNMMANIATEVWRQWIKKNGGGKA